MTDPSDHDLPIQPSEQLWTRGVQQMGNQHADQPIQRHIARQVRPSRSAPTSVVWSAWSVDVAALLFSVNQDGLVVFEDLVDDSVVTATRRPETLEFAYQRFTQPLGVLGDRPEDGLQGCMAHLVG